MRPCLPASAAPLLATLLAAAALTGCGSSTRGNGVAAKSPAEILAGAKVLADAAKSVHVAGTIHSASSPIALDLSLLAGKGGRGVLSESGLSFELIQIHGTVFIKGSPAFFTHIAGPSAAQLLQGRWLKASAASGGLAALASLTDLGGLVNTALAAHGPLTKGAITTVDGQKAIAVMDPSTGGSLYVATTGPPYPIKITMGGAGAGSITFEQWNQPVLVFAPANSIDINALRAGH